MKNKLKKNFPWILFGLLALASALWAQNEFKFPGPIMTTNSNGPILRNVSGAAGANGITIAPVRSDQTSGFGSSGVTSGGFGAYVSNNEIFSLGAGNIVFGGEGGAAAVNVVIDDQNWLYFMEPKSSGTNFTRVHVSGNLSGDEDCLIQTNGNFADDCIGDGIDDDLATGTAFPGSPAAGDTFVILDDSAIGECDSAAGSARTLCEYDGANWVAVGSGSNLTQIFQGKTIHVHNNVVTVTSPIPLTPATCQNATAYLNWDHETTNFPAATCVTGSNTQKAYADFDQTTDECIQTSIPMNDEFVPGDGVDVTYWWLTTATSGSVAWCTQVICVGNTDTDDPSFPAQASGNCVSDTAQGTTNQMNIVTDTSITVTGCAASEIMHIRTCRDPNETGGQTDTVAADARLANMVMKIRREM